MALTNSRPVDIPTLENETIHNSTSPVFQPSSLGIPSHDDSQDVMDHYDLSPSSDATSDSNYDFSKLKNSVESKKKPSTTMTSAASGVSDISKMVPVTGERPKPQTKDPSMVDEVLYAIFVILWEEDPQQKGMTVKQLCDHLLEKHPQMSSLSTKLSNLISAKLNAYVKKVEKGEKTLTYALSREWSDASPKRMVYIYRGVLAADYKAHAQAVSLQRQESKSKLGKTTSFTSKKSNASGSGSGVQSSESTLVDSKIAGSFSRSFNVSNAFSIHSYGSDFNVPYASSPVSIGLAPKMTDSLGTFQLDHDPSKVSRQKRSSSSYPPVNKKPKLPSEVGPAYVTAAAAAPRLSRVGVKKVTNTSESAAAIVAAIHRVAATQRPVEVMIPTNGKTGKVPPLSDSRKEATCATWLKTIRDGFLTEEIESPEALSVEDLDGFLN
ncbi:LAFE_0D12134g1_1 [Lachancea fermentati]|uniref:LAFE_0D12134g1_1 n=1 Tax=Lachancea fermentati TaxID=4955 RepID=A0A1G4MBY5_LACFM|nr:LAFE_0D12134g1_1 [Lachancea fermentati]